LKSIFIGGGAFGFIAVIGAFAYVLLFQPDALTVLTNPLAAAFIVEALVLVVVWLGAYVMQPFRICGMECIAS
jgi:hypothetical protein